MEDKLEALDELRKILESQLSDEELVDRLTDYHSADLADLYEELSEEQRGKLLRILPEDELSDLFSYLENPEDFIEAIDKDKAADIIESMDADDAVDVLEELEPATRTEIMTLMEPEAVEDINLIQSYPDDQVGSLMTTNFVIIKRGMSVRQAMKSMIDQAAENDNVSTVYVEDEGGKYYGAINLRDLIVARKGDDLENIIKTSYPSVDATETVAECLEQLKDYSEDSIPVIGPQERVIGVITSDDIVEAAEAAFGDDYAKLAGFTSENDREESIGKSLKKRIPWLVILFVLGLLVSYVIDQFETVIQGLPFIVAFQSLVLDMAGNVGTQSLAVTVRSLSYDTMTSKQLRHMVWREFRVGAINGLILGAGSAVFVGGYLMLVNGDLGMSVCFATAGCIGLALLIAMALSALFGTLIPMMFKKMHIDPAVASGPLITTINDLIAAVAYYGFAWLFILTVMGFVV
ncbi:MAG: magnesium transporter [Clostridia bacterium]|nr:magnesium transporter [Clostridia bacterium]